MQETSCHLVKSQNTSSVTIYNINIIATVMTNFTAIQIVNTQDDSKIINVKVKFNSFICATFNNYPVQISGLTAHYSNGIFKRSKLTITNFYYNNTYNSCANHFHCAVAVLFFQSNVCIKEQIFRHNLMFHIQNSVFSNLRNSSVLYYYGEADGECDVEFSRTVVIENSTFSNNSADPQSKMFYIILKSLPRNEKVVQRKLYSVIIFHKCIFTRNTNMEAIIYLRPPTTEATVAYIMINNSTFYENKNVNFIKVKKESQTTWYVTIYFRLSFVNISSNEHNCGDNLILITNGHISIRSVVLNQNCYYENIINLQSSMGVYASV